MSKITIKGTKMIPEKITITMGPKEKTLSFKIPKNFKDLDSTCQEDGASITIIANTSFFNKVKEAIKTIKSIKQQPNSYDNEVSSGRIPEIKYLLLESLGVDSVHNDSGTFSDAYATNIKLNTSKPTP